MDSGSAQDGRPSPGGEKRRGKDSLIRQRHHREVQGFEKADPTPVATLGPVPSIREQTAMLMQDPRWVLQQMRARMDEDAGQVEVFSDDEDDFLDDEPEWFTGYQLHEMQPIPTPEDKAEAGRSSESEALMGDSQPDDGHESAPAPTSTPPPAAT